MSTIEEIRAVWVGHDHSIAGSETIPLEAYNEAVYLAADHVATLLAEVDQRDTMIATVRGLLNECGDWLGTYQCQDQEEGDDLIDFERRIAEALAGKGGADGAH